MSQTSNSSDPKPLVDPRDNPSDAQQGRALSKREKLKYRIFLFTGILMLFLPFLLIALVVTDILEEDKLGINALWLITGIFVGPWLIDIGITNGRDRRTQRGATLDN